MRTSSSGFGRGRSTLGLVTPKVMGLVMPRVTGLVVVLVTGLLSHPAQAGNSEHPRTPVLWPEADCIQTVVRAADPQLSFGYAIPLEDTLLSIDELADSRTHQFIGFCRQWPAGRPPPRYIAVADLERAIDADFELVLALGDPEATLETSEVWADCWARITPDDARRPITFAAAAEPVVWDTSDLAVGTWMVAGYTWEPPYNLWSRAPWVVRVDPDVDAGPQPAAVLADTPDAIYFDETLDLSLCVDAELGASVSLEWAATQVDPTIALVWTPIADTSTTLAVAGEQTLSLASSPPEPTWGATIVLRAIVEGDPAYISHALASVTVFKPASEDPDEAETAGEDTGAPSESGESESGGPSESGDPSSDEASSGGRCSLLPGRGNLGSLLVLFVSALGLSTLRARARVPFPDHRA